MPILLKREQLALVRHKKFDIREHILALLAAIGFILILSLTFGLDLSPGFF